MSRRTYQETLVSLIIIEGYTEEAFYPYVKECCFQNLRTQFRNLRGQGNPNKQVLREIYSFFTDYPDTLFRTYCCLDTETGNRSITPLDLAVIRNEAIERGFYNLLSVDAILADREIESWFFYDLDGIYDFLNVPPEERIMDAYNPAKDYGKFELQTLFRKYGERYIPGKKATSFFRSLDLNKIIAECTELRNGIDIIISQANDFTYMLSL